MTTITTFKKHEWLSQEIRREILDQKIPAGQKLLTDKELMEKYKFSRATVVHAMKKLQQEGFISRKIGAGTFVQDKMIAGEIAVVGEDKYFSPENTPIWHMTIYGLVEAVRQRSPLWRAKIHMITPSPHTNIPPTNCDLLDPQVVSTLRGILTMVPLRGGMAEELANRGIPSIVLGQGVGSYHPNQIFFDMDQLYPLAFSHLAQIGCKTVGFFYEGQGPNDFSRHVAKVTGFARETGLLCRPEWMVFCESPHKTERAGYELFHRLWKQPVRPEALFVEDDLNFRGVVRAAMELGVRFPEDIRVITISPIGVPLPYHKPVTIVGFDVPKLTTTAVEMMEQLIRGVEPENRHILLPLEIIKGETT